MNKNITPIILVVLAIGVYFTFTKGKIDEVNAVRAVNASYEQALNNSEKLVTVRDGVLKTYNNISQDDKVRLDKMLPNNIDNVRLIIDVNGVASRHGLIMKNVKTSMPSQTIGSNATTQNKPAVAGSTNLSSVTLSFSVSTNYQTFLDFIKDLEASLRIMDISKITLSANDNGSYDYGVELKTYWLKQ